MAITLGADDKKKIYLLAGLAGLLGVGALVVFNPFGGSSDGNATANAALVGSAANVANAPGTSNNVGMPSPVRPPGGGNLQIGAPVSSAVLPTGGAFGLVPQIPGIGRTRNDPFVQFTLPALPPPPPTPVPTRVIQEPVPLDLPSYQTPSAGTGANLPLNTFPPGLGTIASTTLYLPPATMFNRSQRQQPQSLPEIGGVNVGTPGSQTQANNASGKRVAGIILGDTIRALIEYQENGQTVSKVVQPGDEVGGMKILSIQRVRSGDKSVVRVTILEKGQEEFFDLG